MMDTSKLLSDINSGLAMIRKDIEANTSVGLKSLADFEFQTGNYVKAEEYYLQALSDTCNDKALECHLHYCLARVYSNLGDVDKEVASIYSAIKLENKLDW